VVRFLRQNIWAFFPLKFGQEIRETFAPSTNFRLFYNFRRHQSNAFHIWRQLSKLHNILCVSAKVFSAELFFGQDFVPLRRKKIRNGLEKIFFTKNFSIGVKWGEKNDGGVRFWI